MLRKRWGRNAEAGGIDGRIIIPIIAIALLVTLAVLAINVDGNENVSEIHEYECGDRGGNVIARLDINTKTMTVSGNGAMKNFSNADEVPWKADRKHINQVQIGNGVTTVGDYSFYNSFALVTVTVGNDVKTIGESAFRQCNSLRNVTISNSVTSIGDYAFSGCYNIESITLPNSITTIGDNAFNSCHGLKSITIPKNVTSIGSNTFIFCFELKTIIIDERVTGINPYAFPNHVFYDGETKITEISGILGNIFTESGEISAGIHKMVKVPSEFVVDGIRYHSETGNNASIVKLESFSESEFTIPATVTHSGNTYNVIKIGDNAFENCIILQKLTLPSTLKWIGSDAFKGCANLKEITVENGVTGISSDAFPDRVFYEHDIKLEIQELPGKTFVADGNKEGKIKMAMILPGFVVDGVRYCYSGNDVVIYSYTVDFQTAAFEVPSKVSYDGNDYTVTKIGERAFADCTVLQKLIVSDNMQSIDSNAFKGCANLKEIKIGNKIGTIDPNAFPSHVFYDGEMEITDMSKLAGNVFWDSGKRIDKKIKMINAEVFTDNGIKYVVDGYDAVIIGVDSSFSKSEFTVPKTVIHEGVTCNVFGIIENSFKNCTVLQKLKVPNTVQFIDANAFGGCTNLKTITIAGSANSNAISIDDNAFPSHAFFTKSGTSIAASKLPGYTYYAGGTTADGKIKMIRDEPSPAPQPEPVPTPDKPINDPTMTFMAVIIGTVIALAGLAILIARRK